MRVIKTLITKIKTKIEENRVKRFERERTIKISEAKTIVNQTKRSFEKKAEQELSRRLEEHPLRVESARFDIILKSLNNKDKQIQMQYENSSWWGKWTFKTPLTLYKNDIREISNKKNKFLTKNEEEIKNINKKYKKANKLIKQRLNDYFISAQPIIEQQYKNIDTDKVLNYGMWGSIFGLTASASNDLYESHQVYDALRNVNSNFEYMSDSEIWWETLFMETDSLVGLSSLTKGALFENMVANDIGGELFEQFNHPVTDIVIDGTEIQLKATDSVSYVNNALENSTVMATSEVAENTGAIDSGILNEDLTDQVVNALGGTVLDVGDIAYDTFLGGSIGLGAIPTLKGLAHINKNVNDPDRYIEGAEIAIVGTAKVLVDTSEMMYNVAKSRPGKAVGKAGLNVSIGVGKGFIWGLKKILKL